MSCLWVDCCSDASGFLFVNFGVPTEQCNVRLVMINYYIVELRYDIADMTVSTWLTWSYTCVSRIAMDKVCTHKNNDQIVFPCYFAVTEPRFGFTIWTDNLLGLKIPQQLHICKWQVELIFVAWMKTMYVIQGRLWIHYLQDSSNNYYRITRQSIWIGKSKNNNVVFFFNFDDNIHCRITERKETLLEIE